MSDYTNLATLAFRVASIGLFLQALFGLVVATNAMRIATKLGGSGTSSSFVWVAAIGGLIIAVLLYLIAPVLGRFAARGLGSTERTA